MSLGPEMAQPRDTHAFYALLRTYYIGNILFKLCNHLAEEERACCFTLIVFLPSCGYSCNVSLPFVMFWSVVCFVTIPGQTYFDCIVDHS